VPRNVQFTARQIKLEHAAEALIIERGNRIPVRSEARVPETQYVPPRAAVDKLSDLFQRGASEAQRALHGLAFVRGETILGAQISEHPQCMREVASGHEPNSHRHHRLRIVSTQTSMELNMVPDDQKTEVVPPAEVPEDLPLPSDPSCRRHLRQPGPLAGRLPAIVDAS
jgi:hypothetical protein